MIQIVGYIFLLLVFGVPTLYTWMQIIEEWEKSNKNGI